MNPTQLKYLQGCVRSRILGNRVEFHHRDNVKIYRAINLILNDVRFITILDSRIGWIGYASKYIAELIDSITDWKNTQDWEDKIEAFIVSWFIKHFGRDINLAHHKFTYSNDNESCYGRNACDNDAQDMEMLMRISSDMTNLDDSPYKFRHSPYMPEEIADFVKACKNESDETVSEIEYLHSIDKTIVDLALKLGRSGGIEAIYSEKSKFGSSFRSDITGITIGNNLNAMLPTETALLGDTATENVFYRRYAEKQLQVFASASSSMCNNVKQNGPIIICIDTSSSMDGDNADTAKRLALAVAIVAQRTRRTLCVINYSDNLSYFVLTNFRRQKMSFIKFLLHSYHGGNDENLLFSFIFRLLLNNPKYSHIRKKIAGADMLVISDFEWEGVSKRNSENISNARKNGMRFFSLDVDAFGETFGAKEYLKQCDYRYDYIEGKCVEKT
ncbi:MAG: hypothetical protein IIV64_05760 [Muribaculaceae bacterium]|nr:hypothetical protein [Muribaculaceae bacterium]